MADLLAQLIDKMVRRHPHVFGDARSAPRPRPSRSGKRSSSARPSEQGRPRSVIDGVPRALPALLRAQRMQSKAARVELRLAGRGAAWTKVEEEMRETPERSRPVTVERIEEELGDVLFSLVNVARLASLDAEEALHGAIEKFRRRFAEMEAELTARGTSVAACRSRRARARVGGGEGAGARAMKAQIGHGHRSRRARRHHGLGSRRDRQRGELHARHGHRRRRRRSSARAGSSSRRKRCGRGPSRSARRC